MAIIQQLGPETIMIKWDFADAFRQVPVSPDDTPLLGFSFRDQFYAERFLPFGLRTAPYLFNLFAELFHWLLEQHLQVAVEGAQARVVHYLDDFIVLLPPGYDWRPASDLFQQLAGEVGLKVKEKKNEEGMVVNFGGVIFDTCRMVIRLPSEKKTKGLAIMAGLCPQSTPTITLYDLQQLTGFLNFVTLVVPIGRAFLRRLYNLQQFFPHSRFARRRLSREAQKDLTWWRSLLTSPAAIERSFQQGERRTFLLWTDAAGLKGLGGYYQLASPDQADPTSHLRNIDPAEAFMLVLPRTIQLRQEHINTKEMRAVEQGLLRWGRVWKGARVISHIDNQAVVHGIANHTIWGTTMDVLRRCLLLTSKHDIEFHPCWIPTEENKLADALSRCDRTMVTNLAPQLSSLFDHQLHGFQMSEIRD